MNFLNLDTEGCTKISRASDWVAPVASALK